MALYVACLAGPLLAARRLEAARVPPERFRRRCVFTVTAPPSCRLNVRNGVVSGWSAFSFRPGHTPWLEWGG